VAEDATDAEIERAYRRLISQYHPDKLVGVAEELRRQAEQKAGEINAAYDRIQALRKRS
jgi:curved DNA-binding protein CbpA